MTEEKTNLIATALVCHMCDSSSFVEKKHEGSILLHCSNCKTPARVSKAGIVNVEAKSLVKGSKVFPTPRQTPPKKNKETVFAELRFVVPEVNKKVVQAAMWCAKGYTGATGKWFMGSMLTFICAEYLSSFDYDSLDPKTFNKVKTFLDEIHDMASKEQDREEALKEIDEPQYRELSEKQLTTALSSYDKAGEAAEKIAKEKESSKEKRKNAMVRGKATAKIKRRLETLRAIGPTETRDSLVSKGDGILLKVEAGEMAGSDEVVVTFCGEVDTFIKNLEKMEKVKAKEAEKIKEPKVDAKKFLNRKLMDARVELGKAKGEQNFDLVEKIEGLIIEIKNVQELLKSGDLLPEDESVQRFIEELS